MGWRPQKSKRRFLSKECKDPVESGGMLNGKVVSCKLFRLMEGLCSPLSKGLQFEGGPDSGIQVS